jgi:DNA-binding NtrC family response regulator
VLRLVITHDDRVRRVPITSATHTVGAAADNDVVIACTGVSRHHATLKHKGETLIIKDAGSKNGLLVGGRRVDSVELSPGDAVQLGRALMKLERVSASDAELSLRIHAESTSHGSSRRNTDSMEAGSNETARALQWLRDAESFDGSISGAKRRDLLARAREVMSARAIVLCRIASSGSIAFEEISGDLPSDAAASELTAAVGKFRGAPPFQAISAGDWIVVPIDDRRAVAAEIVHGSRGDWRAFLEFVTLRLFADRADRRKSGSVTGDLVYPDRYIAGTSSAMRRLHEQLLGAARTRAHVLLRGENGTGKELVAEILHASGSTAKGPFRAINCAAIPAELIEAELFGVRQRVATGVDPRAGLFVEANHGTVFLDEIGDLPLSLQPKLLRVLQEREIQPLGTSKPVKIDVRIISSTNRNLEQMLRDRTFREDLYYRLRGLEFTVPSLRERREDIPAFATEFISRIAESHHKRIEGVSRKALAQLMSYAWPGNVRELENVLERAIARCPSGGTLESTYFDDLVSAPSPRPASSLQSNLAITERETILTALRRTDGNKSEAARLLGITRAGLYLKLRRHKID